jgi:hypothetical protein
MFTVELVSIIIHIIRNGLQILRNQFIDADVQGPFAIQPHTTRGFGKLQKHLPQIAYAYRLAVWIGCNHVISYYIWIDRAPAGTNNQILVLAA